MYFRVTTGKTSGKPSWWLFGENHKQVAWAGETFASLPNARRAAEAFRSGIATAKFEVYEDKADVWRWRASQSSDKVAASGESFDSKANAERAMKNVQDNGGDARFD